MEVILEQDSTTIGFELEELERKIDSVRAELLDAPDEEHDAEPSPSPPAQSEPFPPPADSQVILVSSQKTSRLSQLRSKFRFNRKGSANKSSTAANSPDDEAKHLRSESSSLDSSITLFDVPVLPSPPSPERQPEDARYLALLAPLVATIQRLSPVVRTIAEGDTRTVFLKRCEELTDLLMELKKEALFSPPAYDASDSPADADDDDMRVLVLTALHRKVLLESSRYVAPVSAGTGSLAVKADAFNPFVFHSTTRTVSSGTALRTPSPPKAIAPILRVPEGEFSNFMGHSQQTWRANVHRLGSFQASALFSPSPIAVNRAVRVGAVRL